MNLLENLFALKAIVWLKLQYYKDKTMVDYDNRMMSISVHNILKYYNHLIYTSINRIASYYHYILHITLTKITETTKILSVAVANREYQQLSFHSTPTYEFIKELSNSQQNTIEFNTHKKIWKRTQVHQVDIISNETKSDEHNTFRIYVATLLSVSEKRIHNLINATNKIYCLKKQFSTVWSIKYIF